jgi:hypothetical protein
LYGITTLKITKKTKIYNSINFYGLRLGVYPRKIGYERKIGITYNYLKCCTFDRFGDICLQAVLQNFYGGLGCIGITPTDDDTGEEL